MEKQPSPDRPISAAERQDYCTQLQIFIQTVSAMGANDSEVEAQRLLRRLQDPQQIVQLSEVIKIIGLLGDPDDKNTKALD